MMGINQIKSEALVHILVVVRLYFTSDNSIFSMTMFNVSTMGFRICLKIFLWFDCFISSLRLYYMCVREVRMMIHKQLYILVALMNYKYIHVRNEDRSAIDQYIYIYTVAKLRYWSIFVYGYLCFGLTSSFGWLSIYTSWSDDKSKITQKILQNTICSHGLEEIESCMSVLVVHP